MGAQVHPVPRNGSARRVLFPMSMRNLADVSKPIWYRVLIATWALWLAAALAEVGPLGACPKHGHHGIAAPSASHGAHQSHAAGMGATPTRSHPADQSHAACTCLGLSCCAAAVALPGAPTALVPVTERQVDVALWPYANVTVARAPHVLPFANGPPVIRIV